MKIAVIAGLLSIALCGQARSAETPRMSDADTRFYGILPCAHDPCVTFMLYTISICIVGKCQPLHVASFEYTDLDRCADQVITMRPINNIGWYECTPNIVSQQMTR